MLLHLLSSALLLVQQTDSTVPVKRGQRLEVNTHAGAITVTTWNRDAVHVRAEQSNRTRVEITSSATTVAVRTTGRRGPPDDLELSITAPEWMPLDLRGLFADVTVVGSRAGISAETVQGDISVEGGDGLISLRSVEGGVTLRNARGRIEVHSVNDDIAILASAGDVAAETVNGEIMLGGVETSSLTASTINGDIEYHGPVQNGGRYALSSHNGDLTLTVAQGTNAAISVSTFNGEFESEFPVTLTEARKGRRFSFTIGTGSAQVSLESFQGSIRLIRPSDERNRGPAR